MPLPTLVANTGRQAEKYFLEFFSVRLRTDNTRRNYLAHVRTFMLWAEGAGIKQLHAVEPVHISAWLAHQRRTHSTRTIKAQLSAVRGLFTWLSAHGVLRTNPIALIQPKLPETRQSTTPALSFDEAQHVIFSIPLRPRPPRPRPDRRHAVRRRARIRPGGDGRQGCLPQT